MCSRARIWKRKGGGREKGGGGRKKTRLHLTFFLSAVRFTEEREKKKRESEYVSVSLVIAIGVEGKEEVRKKGKRKGFCCSATLFSLAAAGAEGAVGGKKKKKEGEGERAGNLMQNFRWKAETFSGQRESREKKKEKGEKGTSLPTP